MTRRSIALLVPLALSAALFACGDDGGSASSTGATKDSAAAGATSVHVVASTTWTGAYAKLAGATDIDVIAPTSVLHPPDYDPKPSDLVAASDADIVVYAEFESFAKRLTEAAGSKAKIFPLTLENTAKSIESEVMRLATELGTQDAARKNLDQLLAKASELAKDAATHVPAVKPVVVAQAFVNYWADWAGLATPATFGPAQMSAGDLAKLMDLKPTLVFDNHHVPGGQAFEADGIPRIELINYPGEDLDLAAVFEHNYGLIVAAFDGKVTADTNVSVPEGGGAHGHGATEATTAHGASGAHGASETTTGHGHDATETTTAAHGHGESTTATPTTAGAHSG